LIIGELKVNCCLTKSENYYIAFLMPFRHGNKKVDRRSNRKLIIVLPGLLYDNKF